MSNIIIPKVVMSFKSEGGYHTFNCPACDQRNKVHEKRAINFDPDTVTTGSMHFSCVGCHREVHVDRCPVGGLIVL
jgi:hypothetical protein